MNLDVFRVTARRPRPSAVALEAVAELGVSEHYLQVVGDGAYLEMDNGSGIYAAIWDPSFVVEMNSVHQVAECMPGAVAVGVLDWAFLLEGPSGVVAADPGNLGFEDAEYICQNLQDLLNGDIGNWRIDFRPASI